MLNNFYPYAESVENTLKELKSDKDFGLTETEVLIRQEKNGLNELTEGKKQHFFVLFLKQFKNPLAILLIIAGILTLFLKEYNNSIIIISSVFINSLIGFIEEKKVKDAFSKLKSSLKKYALVLRNGEKKIIEAKYVVSGDIIILKEGDMVPADARILEGKGLMVNESILTGEWLLKEKSKEKVELKSRITNQLNMLFTGTLIEKGWAKAIVTAVSDATEFGKIADSLKINIKKITPFQKNIAKISRFIGFAVFFIVLILFLVGILRGIDKIEMFLSAVAIAVAAVPEGLPIAVTVILVLGMKNIIKKGGLPKNLSALEVLGSANVILTDKTGTLTYANMKVSRIASPLDINLELKKDIEREKEKKLSKKDAEMEEIKSVLRNSILESAEFSSDAFIENPKDELKNWIIRGDSLEKAIIEAGIESGVNREELFLKNPRLDFLPFDSERRFSASIHNFYGKKTMFLIGAPETIISFSSNYSLDGKEIKKITNREKNKFLNFYEEEGKKGLRMIAVAKKEIDFEEFSRGNKNILEQVKDLFFLGLIGFHDPVREEVADYVVSAKKAGIDIKIVTGDNLNTASAVALKIGLLSESLISNSKMFLTGEELEKMNKEELQEKIDDVKILSRVLPHQKMMIVEALQAKNKIVAMTGDGINDAPALFRSDIGVALNSGTDTAKESADIVLTNNSFAVIVHAIKEGRIIVENIRKVITYLLSTGFSEIILIGGSIFVGFPLPVFPVQILWANIVQEGFMNFAYAFEKDEEGIMEKNRAIKGNGEIFTREMKILIFIIGIVTDFFLLILFAVLLKLNFDLAKIRTIMFIGLSSDAIFFAFSLKNLKKPIWKINILNNKYLLFAWFLSLLALISALIFPVFRELLQLVPISINEFLIIFGIGILNLISIEFAKFWLNRKR